MASPHAAGAAALYLGASPTATPATVRNALVSNGTTGRVTNPGTGSPNVLLYSGFLNGGTPPPPEPPPPRRRRSSTAASRAATGWTQIAGRDHLLVEAPHRGLQRVAGRLQQRQRDAVADRHGPDQRDAALLLADDVVGGHGHGVRLDVRAGPQRHDRHRCWPRCARAATRPHATSGRSTRCRSRPTPGSPCDWTSRRRPTARCVELLRRRRVADVRLRYEGVRPTGVRRRAAGPERCAVRRGAEHALATGAAVE